MILFAIPTHIIQQMPSSYAIKQTHHDTRLTIVRQSNYRVNNIRYYLTIVLLCSMCPEFLLVPHDALPHVHSLGQSDSLRKLFAKALEFRQAAPLQKYFQSIHKSKL